jgi:hypothetical protein
MIFKRDSLSKVFASLKFCIALIKVVLPTPFLPTIQCNLYCVKYISYSKFLIC